MAKEHCQNMESNKALKSRLFAAGNLLVVMFPAFFCACAENPFFGDDKITGGKRQISGHVILKDGASPESVFVWLEDFNISAFTNKAGEFRIILPPKPRGQPIGGISRHKAYFYLANYLLSTVQVTILDGEFYYDHDDINKDGQVRNPIRMQRFLSISTEVSPPSVQADDSVTIVVEVKLQADIDCASVVNPKIRVKNKFLPIDTLGAIVVKRLDSDEVFVIRSDSLAENNEQLVVCREPVMRRLNFKLSQTPLPPGKYEAIPYLLVNPKGVPFPLLASLGSSVNELSANYLKKPMRRQNGQFEIKN
jgi:hypothetical protein